MNKIRCPGRQWTLKSVAIVTRFTLDILWSLTTMNCALFDRAKPFCCPCQYCGLQLQPTIVTYAHENLFKVTDRESLSTLNV